MRATLVGKAPSLYSDSIQLPTSVVARRDADMTHIPAPHPLDFDWRYDAGTVEALLPLLEHKKVLALGAPSVARRLQAQGTDVTLVDRQPAQGVDRHLPQAVEAFVPAELYDAAIVDPPWYPDALERWAAVAAHAVGPGGLILASVWPETARPSAKLDLALATSDIGQWADVRRLDVPLAYVMPAFEERAIAASETAILAASPCCGVLLEIRPRSLPERDAVPQGDTWHRFLLNDYQLALRVTDPDQDGLSVTPHPGAKGWHWPFVSARAPGRALIDLWSSAGEVAIVRAPAALLTRLRRAFSAPDPAAFADQLQAVPALLDWQIPRPPYGKYQEWQHRQ